jgi:hypothetical protein
MTAARWHDKADAFVYGWREREGDDPTLHAVVLGLAVAQHETACGDAWPGEHNWGAVQKRVPNAQEKAALAKAGVVPSPKNVARAREVIAAAIEAGECQPLTNEALHCDSSPGKGWYFVYFWAFKTDVGGASLFVKILATNRKNCKAVLLNDHGTEMQLADGMYATRYYEGFYEKNVWYVKGADGKWHKWVSADPPPEGAQKGSVLNVRAYGGALAAITPGIRKALVDWHLPSGEPTEDPPLETEPGPEHPDAHADTEPAPPVIPYVPLEVDWDEIRRARDDYIKEWDDGEG